MKVLEFENNYNKFSNKEKKDYLKKLLKDYSLSEIINNLIIYNDINDNIQLLNSLSRTKTFKEKYKMTNQKLNSLIIDSYISLNKTKELVKYLKSLNEEELNKIITYEIKNKTAFSKLKICKQLENKSNKEINFKKKLEIDVITEKKNNNKSKLFLIILLFLVLSYMFVGYCYSSIIYYNSHVYPNIYIDNLLIENMNHQELKDFLKQKENIIKENIILKNDNNNYEYNYENIGFSVNTKEIENNILNITENINGFQKLYKILTRKEYKYKVKYSLDDNKYNSFLEELRNKVNVSKQNEYFKISNGEISYTKGINGFTLDESGLKEEIIDSISNNKREFILKGNVENVNNNLGSINKKVSTFTTYYNEAQGRAKNIRNAAGKVNGTILYPGDVFSFYRAAGPYNGSRGYIFYAKDVGSGVCQVSTTIYNTALKLNLPILARENHGDMVYYVDYGMDATVYGSSVDFKFKNNSNYPIYIEASAYGGTLTISFWSNENIIPNGISYVPRVERLGGLGFKTYLDTYKNGERIDSKYLNSSYYIKGK